MPDNRETLQVNQPNVVNPPENNWPDPLSDDSNKLKMAVTNGSNGSQSNKDITSTSQQDAKAHQLTEGYGDSGSSPNSATDSGGGKGSFTQTSQQTRGEISTPESA